jgi:uncharacterized NAD(P)/FAD-binding protein YdhS
LHETLPEKIHGEAISVRQHADGNAYQVDLADGRSFRSDQVVLAFGHFAPEDPAPLSKVDKAGSYISNPWDSAALELIHGDISWVLA